LNGGGNNYVGGVDDVVVMPRALTAAEVATLYSESVNRAGAAWVTP